MVTVKDTEAKRHEDEARPSRGVRASLDEVNARQSAILHEVRIGNGDIDALSRFFDVSASTIRRDLEQLHRAGLVTRTHGGAIASSGPVERTLREKEQLQRREKMAIAAAAARTVEDGDTVFLDAGSTTGALASLLRTRRLIVVTVGINSILSLYDAENVEVIVLGGVLRQRTESIVSDLTLHNLQRIRIDKAFIGANGISADKGICSPTSAQSYLKDAVAASATEVAVLADSTKLGLCPFPYLTRIERDFTLVVDEGATEDRLRPFHDRSNVTVHTAPFSEGSLPQLNDEIPTP